MKDTSSSLVMLEAAHAPEAGYPPADPVYRGLSMREVIRHFSIKGGTLVSPPPADNKNKTEVKTDANENTSEDSVTATAARTASAPLPCSGSRTDGRRHSLDNSFVFQSTKHGLSVSPSDLIEQPLKKRSKKKLRFADEEGGSLEHVKVFTKEKSELDLELSHLTSLSMLLRSELDLDRDDFGLFDDDFDDEDIQYYDEVFLCEEESLAAMSQEDNDNQYSSSKLYPRCQLWAHRSATVQEPEETHTDDNNNADTPRVEVQHNSRGDSFTPRQFVCALPDRDRRQSTLNAQNVVLDQVSFEDSKFHGSVLVQNYDAKNSVRVRVTFNDWDDFVDVTATYRSRESDTDSDDSESTSDSETSSSDVEMASTPSRVSTFDFEVSIPSEVEKDIQFAVCYEVDGRPFWDTNDGDNYIAIPC